MSNYVVVGNTHQGVIEWNCMVLIGTTWWTFVTLNRVMKLCGGGDRNYVDVCNTVLLLSLLETRCKLASCVTLLINVYELIVC